jgi:uncharacterized protein YgbK (DUF1537 family)
LRTVLFFGVPDAATLAHAHAAALDLVGIAGVARFLPTAAMAAEVAPALALLDAPVRPLHRFRPAFRQVRPGRVPP